jgi:chromosome segregation ATPase
MEKPPTLEKIEHDIKDTSDKIDALRRHIQGLEENIALLKHLEKQLKQNLSNLRDDAKISMASEFKKVKSDLATISARIDVASLDLKNSKVYMERSEKLLLDLKAQSDIIRENENGKVLYGHFGPRIGTT